ncbi:MAG: peptidoglycan-associated lipoprotein Pal [Pseudomonadales bacterium]|jgi:peptidoglycan-associated lipoprotein|nr:peptidoglycan-associated lipoprotein Pal [Pseudomonadales bacterium]
MNIMFKQACILLATLMLGACASTPEYEWVQVPGPILATRQAPPPSEQQEPEPGGPPPGSGEDFIDNAGDRIYFAYDRTELSEEARATLDLQAEWLQRYPNVRARIEGNTDERGTREYNLALGERRAGAVRDYLISRGIAERRLSTVSYGEEVPLQGGTGDASYARNRNARTVVITTAAGG